MAKIGALNLCSSLSSLQMRVFIRIEINMEGGQWVLGQTDSCGLLLTVFLILPELVVLFPLSVETILKKLTFFFFLFVVCALQEAKNIC